jgi:hypothetical protein
MFSQMLGQSSAETPSDISTDVAAIESLGTDASVEAGAATEQTQEATALEQTAEAPAAVIEPSSDLTQDATIENTISQEGNLSTTVAQVRPPLAIMTASLNQLQTIAAHDRAAQHLQAGVRDLEMVTAFAKVARDHNMSSTLAAAFNATPGFNQAVKAFPGTELYNIVPEHQTSAMNAAGLEAFDVSTVAAVDTLKDRAVALTTAFANVFTNLGEVADQFLVQVRSDKAALEALDVADEVVSTLPVNTISDDAFTQVFTKLEDQIAAVDKFDDNDLRAAPQQIAAEVAGLESLAGDIGPVLGMKLTAGGLEQADKAADFLPTQGTFGDKALTKDGLVFHLAKAESLMESVKGLADRSAELTAAADAAANDMPSQANSDDVHYGSIEHVTLLSCYTTLATKLVQEAVLATTMALQAADGVLNVDGGTQI